MGVNLSPFLKLGSKKWEKAIKVLSLFCWVFGGCMLAYNWYEAIHWTIVFPFPNKLAFAVWLIHTATRIVALWMPMALLLVHWKVTKQLYVFGYVLGTALAPILCLISVVLILNYQDDGKLRMDFLELMNYKLGDGVSYPSALSYSVSWDGCCSWYGPTDFFEVYKKTDARLNNLEFMEGVRHCYGNVFNVKQEGSKLIYGPPGKDDGIREITGCSMVYAYSAARIMNYIVFATVFTCIVSPLFIALYIYGYGQLGSGAVYPAAQGNQLMPADTENEDGKLTSDAEEAISDNLDELLTEK